MLLRDTTHPGKICPIKPISCPCRSNNTCLVPAMSIPFWTVWTDLRALKRTSTVQALSTPACESKLRLGPTKIWQHVSNRPLSARRGRAANKQAARAIFFRLVPTRPGVCTPEQDGPSQPVKDIRVKSRFLFLDSSYTKLPRS